MSECITVEFSTLFQEVENRFYEAGFSGKAYPAFPKLTLKTTAEDIFQVLISDFDNRFCTQKDDITDNNLIKLFRLSSEAFINSYRKGLLKRIS